MYGIVNKAMEDLVVANFSQADWDAIKEKSGIDIDYFVSNEPYDDSVTYQLVGAASEVLNIPVNDLLVTFGEYWVLKTGKEKYGALMEAGGANLRDFLLNLPLFHNRVMLIYPNLTPPEFKVSDATGNSLNLHYFSQREALAPFVQGLLQGLGKMFNTQVGIQLLQSRAEGHDHEVFRISW